MAHLAFYMICTFNEVNEGFLVALELTCFLDVDHIKGEGNGLKENTRPSFSKIVCYRVHQDS